MKQTIQSILSAVFAAASLVSPLSAERKKAYVTNLHFIGHHCFLQLGGNMDNAQ